jgi:cytosine/adenosine deaminase-related metal-dependent hydrolase
VFPVARPPIEDGAVLASGGRIVRVGPRSEVGRGESAATRIDLGEAALLPGPVNAHVHLELGWAHGTIPRSLGMPAWVEAFLAGRAGAAGSESEAAADGVRACRAHGTAAVADVANTRAGLQALASSGLHGVVFREVFALETEKATAVLTEAWDDALATSRASPRLRGCVTAHAPHTLSDELLAGVARLALESGTPLSIHCAESDDEVRLLRDGTGGFADLLKRWGRPLPTRGATPLSRLRAAGLVGPRTLLVHGVHLGDDDIRQAAAARCAIVVCPRSNAFIGVGTAPVPRFLDAGLRVALGTDSLASNDDLDMFAEMAALRRDHPGLAPEAVLRAATMSGAEALGLEGDVGSLGAGRVASMVAVTLAPRDDPLEAMTSGPPRSRRRVLRPELTGE